jgi:ABC-type multidrug transport system ATPase subunit/ABC-type transport system involved in multi-copper enzyme maturation permease subunit
MIEVLNVSKFHGHRRALSGVSLQINPGQVTLLLGANGAGKSTLLRALLGIVDYEGQIRVAGLDPLRDGPKVRALIGYMPQSGGLPPDLTVIETMRLFAALRQAPPDRCQQLLAEAGLSEHRDVRVGDLSGGMRQRLGFAVALLTDPPILVLDEPSASLDAHSREWLSYRLRLAAREGRVVLISTHADQEMLSAGDRRLILEDGRLVSSDGVEADVTTTPRAATPAKAAPLVRKELADAVGNRWLIGYAFLLGVLGLAAAATGMDETAGLALQAFGRTTATLMNLCLLLAPLVAVLMGSAAIAGERERGTLEHLLAQPLSRTQLLLAKYTALVVSLVAATVTGFVPAGILIVSAAGPGVIWHYLLFPLIASVVGIAMAGVGITISVASRTAVQAQGVAVFTWFGFVLLYDLVLVATLAASGLTVQLLAAALVANPVDAARVLGTLALEPDLYLLGPAGAYLTTTLSRSGTALLLSAALLAWAVCPLMLAVARFRLPAAHQTRLRRTSRVASQPRSRTTAKEIVCP